MRLWKISYTSIAAVPEETAIAEAIALCEQSRARNAECGITGVLTLHKGRFAQVLEGPESALRALMRRIAADPRHHDINVIADGPIVRRRYAEFWMDYREPRAFVTEQLDDVLMQTAEISRAMKATWH